MGGSGENNSQCDIIGTKKTVVQMLESITYSRLLRTLIGMVHAESLKQYELQHAVIDDVT